MTKRLLILTVCGFLAVSAAHAAGAGNDQALRTLDEKIQAAFNDVPLSTAFDYLKVRTGLTIDVNWRLLGKVKITKDTPVILELSNHSVRTCLDVLCLVVGGDKMTWTLEDGTVKVSTSANLVNWRVTRTYSIRAASEANVVTVKDMAERITALARVTKNVSLKQQGSKITAGATLAGHRQLARLVTLCEKGPAAGSLSDIGRLRMRLAVKQLPTVQFVDTPLKHVVTFIQNMTGQAVVVDWPALKTAGLTTRATVSLNMKNVSALKVVDSIVEQLGGAGKKLTLAMVADAQVMMITTPAVATQQVHVVAIDILPQSKRDKTTASLKAATALASKVRSLMAARQWSGGYKALVTVGRSRLVCINTEPAIREVSDKIDLLWGLKTR